MPRRVFQKFLLISILLLTGMANAFAAISKSEAAAIAQQRFQGRVIAVKPVQKNSRSVYKVKILDKQGELHTVIINADTGAIISAH